MEKIPVLSSRIHRRIAGDVDDGVEEEQVYPALDGGVDTAWTFEDAERRLRAAFDRNGISGWAEAALNELEAEAEMERLKRERVLKLKGE